LKHDSFSPVNDPGESRMLVNKLSVGDARRLMRLEGDELDGTSFVRQLCFAIAFALATGYAIFTGDVTVWHLAMPLLASWFGLVTAIPVLYLVYRHRAIGVEALKSLLNLAILAAIIVGVVIYHMTRTRQSFSMQFAEDADAAWKWVRESNIHWAMLVAYFNIVASMPSRVHNLMEFGPPFIGVGLGCAMQLIVLFTGVFLVPLLYDRPRVIVWWLWATLLLANALTLYLQWDVGKRLKKYDAERLAAKTK
jgi:hypothetical protein